jgi:hypothetical protein
VHNKTRELCTEAPHVRGENLCYKPVIVGYDKLGKPKKASCRKCIECLQVRANEWGVRCHFELNSHKQNCFVTLTYSENPIYVIKSEVQKFIKRLRKMISPTKIKYFACGEYGDKKMRPHYHIVIFGYDFDDKEHGGLTDSEKAYYFSPKLEKLWPYGRAIVQEANIQTVRYSAKYSAKLKNTLPEHLKEFPEFNLMSKNMGIEQILEKMEIYMKTDEIYIDGFKYPIPQIVIDKYFFKILDGLPIHEIRQAINDWKSKRQFTYQSEKELKNRKRLAEKKKFNSKLRKL